MAIYTVELDGNQFDIEGPDGASEDDLLAAARQHQAGGQTPSQPQNQAESTPSGDVSKPKESRPRRFLRATANALPMAGAVGFPTVAALTTAGTSLPATAGLAGLGGMTGEAAKQLILRGLGDTEGVPQTPEEAAKKIGVTGAKDAAITLVGGKVLQGAGKALKLGKDLITKPGAAEVAQAGKEALVNIGERGAEKLALARSTKELAKKGLIEAEETAGLHFESTPGFERLIADPKKMAAFTEKIGRLAKRTPEELSQLLDSKTLQLFRKVAQEGEKISTLSDIAKSQLRHGKDVFTQALGVTEKGIGKALGRFRDADKVVAEIPSQIKENLVKQKLRTGREVLGAKSLDRKRKVIKGLAGAAAGYLGLKSIVQGIAK